MTTGLNKAFKLSGNSERPSYPGFIVINIPTVVTTFNSFLSNSNVFLSLIKAS